MNDFNFLKKTEDGVVLVVKLTPNASKNEIQGYCQDYVKIRVSAPPKENKANKKLLDFIRDWLRLSKSSVELVSGDKSRDKKILIKKIQYDELVQKICLYDKINT